MSTANFSDDAQTVVEAIQASVKTDTLAIGGQEFTTRPVYLLPEKHDIPSLKISTLDGLIEYLNENVDHHKATDLVIVIENPRRVSVARQVSDSKETRTCWLESNYGLDGFPFDRYLDHEQFVVKAQSLVIDVADRSKLLKLIGNLTTQQVSTSTDDGISQSVVVESGVRKSDVDLPNPVTLAPRRTFPEVDQPSSPFVLRVRQSREGQMPEIALYEADGGFWRTQALTNIKEYIQENLNEDLDIPVIG